MPRLTLSSGWFSRVALVLPLVLGACAEERPPINRVQPNALEKSFFVGKNLADPADDPEFYSAATVIDVPYGVDHGLFSGMAGGLKRLKWEVTEDRLIARATYESYNGADGRGSRRTNDGQVIAAFPIKSHFDIRRAYNPSTGEELNVVEENTSDRPWNERSFFRVDWAINLVTSSIWWDPLAQNTIGGANYGVEPLAYYVNDPANPDAPVFAVNDGYFDVTQKVYVTPKELTLEGTTMPTCLWRGALVMSGRGETGTCESSEIKVRFSFSKVKQPGENGYHEYEPLHWDGARMDAFGIFTVDRKGYDNHYGVVDEAWYRFAQRYNIWAESFAKDGNGDLIACAADGPYDPAVDPTRDDNGDGTDDECEAAGAGSQCNVIMHACTLPYAQREVRTVAWHHHMSNDNAVIVEQSKLATEEWDAAMRIAVQAARQAECRRTQGLSTRGSAFAADFQRALESAQGDPALACEATFFIDQEEEAELKHVRALNRCWDRERRYSGDCVPESGVAAVKPVIAFCHNPVGQNDDDSCGEPGTVTRPGDIRYHSINIWPTPEDSSPWGFGPSWADPLTGEIIQASINVYNAVTDERAQRIVDRARWFAGEIATPSILSGQYVRDRIRQEASPEGSRQFLMSKAEIDRRMLGMLDTDEKAFEQAPALRAMLDPLVGPQVLKSALGPGLAPPSLGGANGATFAARIDAVKNSPLEAKLVGPMWYDAAGVDPATSSSAALEIVSPLRRANARKVLEVQEAVQRRLAENGICLYEAEAPEPSSMPALGKLFERKFGVFDPAAPQAAQADRANRMWNYVRGRMHYGVLLHEMGHTIGERHNFTSSFDKFNYRPQYWQLRAKVSSSGQGVTTECKGPDTDPTGQDCVGPRYYDPLTPEEVDNSIYTWAQTTVMDYSGELTHDWLGLGIYDYAAARMFYGDIVDVRKDLSCPAARCGATSTPGPAANDFVDYPGYLIPQTVNIGDTIDGINTLHYSMWNAFFGLVEGCRAATEAELTPPPDWDEKKNGAWDLVFDGEIVNNEVCRRPHVSYYSWRELQPDLATDPEYIRDPKYYSPRRARTKDDGTGRSYVRVPYSFASDEFRDGWSPAILTRDAGADVYEQTMWFINQYENGHIWNNFRNGRSGFSIVRAYQSELERYHMKLANFAQGLSIIHDYYSSELAKNANVSHAEILAAYEGEGGFMREQAVAAGAVFDHFVRVLTRPQTGVHYTMPGSDGMYLAEFDRIGSAAQPRQIKLTVPNGTTFLGQDLTFGGRPLNNGFEYGQGYWYYDFINQAGSYYEKTYVADMMLNAAYRAPYAFTRWDGIDGRWQFTNFANLFPEGVRRLLGILLTEDFSLVAPRITADQNDRPELVDGVERIPVNPIGWASFVPKEGPEHCFPTSGNYLCRDSLSESILRGTPPGSIAVEPQIGFEIQKFLAFWAYVYMPESQVLDFVDTMRLWKVGEDVDPEVAQNYVGWIDPDTETRYYARAYGKETIFGKEYDKGIASKMLEWADHLTRLAYEIDPASPAEGEGPAIVLRDESNRPIVSNDGITVTTNMPLLCSDNRYCEQLRNYRGLVDFVRDLGHQVGFYEPDLPTVER
jgi:hypothetical protein